MSQHVSNCAVSCGSCAKCFHSGATINQTNQGHCQQHGKDRIFFCLNCSVCICPDCVSQGQVHALHHVDNLAIVYREKLSEVELKLEQVEQAILSMQPDTAVYARNLEVLEKEETSAMEVIDAMAEYSKQQLWCLTSNRKATLRDKLEIPVQKGKLLAELREAVKTLSAQELLEQRSAIDLKCSNLLAGCARNNVVVEPMDDLQCNLISSYWITTLTFPGFAAAVNNCYSYKLTFACDVVWDIVVTKSLDVQIKLTPSDAEIGKFRHKVVVLILHSDFTKVIRNTFEVEGISNTFVLGQASHLTANDKGALEVKVGIHPIDAVVEKSLLNYQYQKLKAKNTGTEQRLATITNGFDYKYHIMNFKMYIWKMENAPEWHSLNIVDDENRHWCLYLQPVMNHYRIIKLEAHVLLQRGTATNCRFFIQMIHEDSAKSILKTMTAFFYQGDIDGWDSFITWKALMGDNGFYPDENLHFRFGVRPLPATK